MTPVFFSPTESFFANVYDGNNATLALQEKPGDSFEGRFYFKFLCGT